MVEVKTRSWLTYSTSFVNLLVCKNAVAVIVCLQIFFSLIALYI